MDPEKASYSAFELRPDTEVNEKLSQVSSR